MTASERVQMQIGLLTIANASLAEEAEKLDHKVKELEARLATALAVKVVPV